MAILNIIIAIILVAISLTYKRLNLIFNIFLSSVTGFFCLKWFFVDLHIWSAEEYTVDNIYLFLKTSLFLCSIVSLLINLVFFNFGIKVIMMRIFEQPINTFHNIFLRKIDKWGHRSVNAYVIRISRRFIRLINKYRMSNIEVGSEISFRDFLNLLCSFFSISIHTLLCCCLLGLGIKFLILLAMVCFVLIPVCIIFIFPFAISYFNTFTILLKHELGRSNVPERSVKIGKW